MCKILIGPIRKFNQIVFLLTFNILFCIFTLFESQDQILNNYEKDCI